MTGEFDDLYGPSHVWWDGLGDEAREWCLALIADIKERGQEPTWAWVHRAMKTKFPDDAPGAESTLKNTLRKQLDG